jgi:hypothetical protein
MLLTFHLRQGRCWSHVWMGWPSARAGRAAASASSATVTSAAARAGRPPARAAWRERYVARNLGAGVRVR